MSIIHSAIVSTILDRAYSRSPTAAASQVAGDVAVLKAFREAVGGGGFVEPAFDHRLSGRVIADRMPELAILTIDRLKTLEAYFREAFLSADDLEIQIWSMTRLPMRLVVSEFGEQKWVPYTNVSCSKELWANGDRLKRESVRQRALKLDHLLYDVLLREGEVESE